MIAERVADAFAELRGKTKETIDLETAVTWGARAVAAWRMYQTTGDLGWRDQSREYAHEAIEHAAGGPRGTLEQVQNELQALMGF